jgi:GAF domain-containing protein
VALQRSVLLVGDYARWPEAVPIAIGRGVGSALAAPLLVGERLIGVLTAYFGQPAVPGDAHAELLSLAAAQVAPALESVKLHAVQTRLLERERALREVTRALASALDEAQVVQLAVSHAARLLEAPYARVWLVEDEAHLRCAAAKGFTYPGLIGERLPVESLVGLGLCQENINLADAPAHPAWRDPTFARRTGLRGYLAVPIRRAGDSLGVLIVMRPQTRFFRGADEQLLRGLADAVAVAVANARALAAVAASEQRLRSTYEAIAPLPAHRLVDWCPAWRWRNDEPARAA